MGKLHYSSISFVLLGGIIEKVSGIFKTYQLVVVKGYKASVTRFPNEDIFVVTLLNAEDRYSNQIRLEFPKFVYQREVVPNL